MGMFKLKIKGDSILLRTVKGLTRGARQAASYSLEVVCNLQGADASLLPAGVVPKT